MPRWLKIFIAAALMVALGFMVDWQELRAHATSMNVAITAITFVVILLQMPSNAAKWFWSLRLHDLHFPWPQLFKVGCMGYFFNNFLPSAIGGDAYRVYRTWSAEGDNSSAVSAVLIERVVGLGILLSNGFIGALFLRDKPLAQAFIYLSLAGAALAPFGIWFLFRLHRRGTLTRRWAKLAIIDSVLARLLQLRIEWLWLLVASLMFQVLAVAALYLCFAAIGAAIDIPSALLITAAAGLAAVLPISIAGIGVVEGSIAGVALALGGSYEAAVLAALLLRLLSLGVSGLCGVFCFFDDGERLRPMAKPLQSTTLLESRTSA